MSRDKQIEEMTKDLCDIDCKGMKCNICDSYGCEYHMQAEALYNAGYRKASEVAWEIFEEIERILDRHSISYLKVGRICGEHYYDGVMQFDIAELKKKYTEEEG